MTKLNLKPVKEFAAVACKIVGYGVALRLPGMISEFVSKEIDKKPVDYYDAVKVIMDSSLLSSYKREALSELKHDESNEYYKTVICIVKSSMLGSDKVKMIHDLSVES